MIKYDIEIYKQLNNLLQVLSDKYKLNLSEKTLDDLAYFIIQQLHIILRKSNTDQSIAMLLKLQSSIIDLFNTLSTKSIIDLFNTLSTKQFVKD